jgi:hypothetical protein
MCKCTGLPMDKYVFYNSIWIHGECHAGNWCRKWQLRHRVYQSEKI